MNWKNKRVLVTGSEGLIGKELVIQLKECGAVVFSVDKYMGHDLTQKEICESLFMDFNVDKKRGICVPNGKTRFTDVVFHLAGIKGNPKMTKERPVDFMGPMLQFDTNMILAAQKYGVKRFLYTSSIAIEYPESDWFPAWAKRTGEELIKAMRIQYPKGTKYVIVRPSNVYGRFDNFDNPNAMVVTSLIRQALKNDLILDKKGINSVRDLINAKDVARGMIKATEQMPNEPVNLCYGEGVNLHYVATLIAKELKRKIKYKKLNLIFGPKIKIMNNPYIAPEIDIEQGIKEIIEYVKNK